MSDIRQKIYDDIDDYNYLCKFFGKKPKGQIDYPHFTKLKKKMDERNKKLKT